MAPSLAIFVDDAEPHVFYLAEQVVGDIAIDVVAPRMDSAIVLFKTVFDPTNCDHLILASLPYTTVSGCDGFGRSYPSWRSLEDELLPGRSVHDFGCYGFFDTFAISAECTYFRHDICVVTCSSDEAVSYLTGKAKDVGVVSGGRVSYRELLQ